MINFNQPLRDKILRVRCFFNNKAVVSFAAIVALVVIFLMKLGDLSVDQMLWAEDGPIFISQSREMGVRSIFSQYSGYLHLYPRCVAYFVSFFDLRFTPLIFLFFCLLSYVMMLYVVVGKAVSLGKNYWQSYFLALLIIAQPHSGEVFFSLTNSQWWIGVALCIFVLTEEDLKEKRFLKMSLVFIASLTGPFSLILLPILVCSLVIFRNWRDKKFLVIPVLIGALVQLIFIVNSGRIGPEESFDRDISNWFEAIKSFIFFGNFSKQSMVFAIVFWLMIFSQLLRLAINYFNKSKNFRHEIQALFVLIAALAFYVSALFLFKSFPKILSPFICGDRYFFLIYSLIFWSAWLLFLNKKNYAACLLFVILVIDYMSLSKAGGAKRDNHQFWSYAEFFKYRPDVWLKISPYEESEKEGWVIAAPNREVLKISDDRVIEVIWDEKYSSRKISKKSDTGDSFFVENDPKYNYLFLEMPKNCKDSKHLGVELVTTAAQNGKLQLFWNNERNFFAEKSLSQKFSAEQSRVYFAFLASEAQYLLLQYSKLEADFQINSTKLYCL